ncbi:MAG: Uncharacterised protein [Opitutia bacterium UBA7350]|nr:MAG: Uncharacterised protein [Opitutae bacterium UBA7350]
MRIKFTLFLLALNGMAFSLLFYLHHRGSQAERNAQRLAENIRIEVASANEIKLSGGALGLPYTISRDGENWQITHPIKWPANYFSVNRILNQLQFIEEDASFSVEAILESGQTLADYGFEDPLLRIELTHDQGLRSISIGTPTEIGNQLYLLGPNATTIYAVDRSSIDSLLIDLDALRSRKIFNLPVFEIDALGLEMKTAAGAGSLKVRLSKIDNRWQFEAPISANADLALVESAIQSLSSMQVTRFVEDNSSDPVAQGLDAPSARITLYGNKRERTLLVGNPDPSARGEATYFARLEDLTTVFTIPIQHIDALREAQQDLRKRDFFEFPSETVDSLVIRENEAEIRLQKLENGNWQIVATAPGDDIQPRQADATYIESLLRDLSQLRALEFVIDNPSPADLVQLNLNNPQRVVELTLSGETPRTLAFAHPSDEDERLYAQASASSFIYEVARKPLLNKLSLNPAEYYERTLLTLPEAATITALKIKPIHPEMDTQALDLKTASGRAATAALVECLRDFHVNRYRNDVFSETGVEPPWEYILEISLLLPDGNGGRETTQRYAFTRRLSATLQIGGSPAHNCTFELNQKMIEALQPYLQPILLPPEAKGAPLTSPILPEPINPPEPTR